MKPRFFDHLADLEAAVVAWRDDPSYELAASCCRVSRSGWQAYVGLYLSKRRHCTVELRQQFADRLHECAGLLREFALQGTLPQDRCDLVSEYASSIAFRAELLAILHERGLDAVHRAIEERKKRAS
ncbi:MAG: hypothetical protein R3F56_03610 [Planctomycetota bacterium]